MAYIRKNCSLTLFISLLFSVLFLCSVILYGCSDSSTQQNNDNTVIKYRIGSLNLDIPLYYHYSIYIQNKKSWPRVKTNRYITNSISLDALLPYFTPWSQENSFEFEKTGRANKSIVGITQFGKMRTAKEFIEFRNGGREVIIPSKNFNKYGLLHYVDKLSVTSKNKEEWQDIYIAPDYYNREYFKIICQREKTDAKIYPSCRVTSIYDDLLVEYSYGVKYLKEWEIIDNNIRNLISTFIKNNKTHITDRE